MKLRMKNEKVVRGKGRGVNSVVMWITAMGITAKS